MVSARSASGIHLDRPSIAGSLTSEKQSVAEHKQSPASTAAKSVKVRQDSADPVRLHITPFTPELQKIYLSASLQSVAQDISYHYTQTTPEKGFGYVVLPEKEAQALIKKLNGSTLRSWKIRIEAARPEKMGRRGAVAAGESRGEEKVMEDSRSLRSSRRIKDKGVQEVIVEGVELPEGRKVKRGWTESPSAADQSSSKPKKSKSKKRDKEPHTSKHLDEPELLFKTTVPPNKVESDKTSKQSRKDKSAKSGAFGKEVLVQEFGKTKKLPYQSESAKGKKLPSEYIEGKGWVDDEGNLIEPVSKRKRNGSAPTSQPSVTFEESSHKESEPRASKSSAPEVPPSKKSRRLALRATTDSPPIHVSPAPPSPPPTGDPSNPTEASSPSGVHPLEALFKRPKATTATSNPTSTSTSTPGASTPSKPSKVPPPISTSFAFFPTSTEGSSDRLNSSRRTPDLNGSVLSTTSPLHRRRRSSGASLLPNLVPPHTPFTRQDLHFRGLRSAAPTPDTAAIGKGFMAPWDRDDEEEDEEDGNGVVVASGEAMEGIVEEEEDDEDGSEDDAEDGMEGVEPGNEAEMNAAMNGGAKGKEGEESEFAKWFWEHRGENNRAWKKRRREALKAVRQRENRRVARKLL